MRKIFRKILLSIVAFFTGIISCLAAFSGNHNSQLSSYGSEPTNIISISSLSSLILAFIITLIGGVLFFKKSKMKRWKKIIILIIGFVLIFSVSWYFLPLILENLIWDKYENS